VPSKVLDILCRTHARGLVSEKLVNIVSDWLSEIEEQYKFYADHVDS